MTLEMGTNARRPAPTPEQREMDRRADELREWLEDLEIWVEKQMAATRAFMVMLTNSRQSDGMARLDGREEGQAS